MGAVSWTSVDLALRCGAPPGTGVDLGQRRGRRTGRWPAGGTEKSFATGPAKCPARLDATATSASALLGIVPAMIFFLIFQRTLTRGIMSGATK